MSLLKNKNDIENWLEVNRIKSYYLIENSQYGFVVNVNDNIDLSYSSLCKIEVKFNNVKGSFWLSHNKLMSLEGCPEEILGEFHCDNNLLTTLLNGPKRVKESYCAHSNQLVSLEGAPIEQINTLFDVSKNKLVSLIGSPHKVAGYYNASDNKITSLEGLSVEVNDLNLRNNMINSTKGICRYIKGITLLSKNELTVESFEQLPEIAEKGFVFRDNEALEFKNSSLSLEELKIKLEKYQLEKIVDTAAKNSILKL